MGKRVVVVGGDAAGMSAASQIRRANPALEVLVFEKGPFASYGACGMPYYIAGEIAAAEELLALKPDQFTARGIEVRLEHEVVEVKPGARTVEVVGTGGRMTERYDYLVLATGGEVVVPQWEGLELENVFFLRGLHDGIALRHFVDERQPEQAVIVGTGLVGVEMAEALLKRGVQVTMIGRSQRLLSTFEPEFARGVSDELTERGLRLVFECQVERLEGRDGRVSGVVTDQGNFVADLVLPAIGIRPAAGLAKRAGIGLGKSGGITVSERMKTDAPGVFAAGDCAEVTHVVTGEKVFSPLALTANRTGRVAGDNLAADSLGKVSSQRFRGTAGTLVTKVFDLTVAQTGLSPLEAERSGFDAAIFERRSRSRAKYYPGGSDIATRIAVDRRTRRLLGAQMIGREGVAGRIDVFATALFNRMTVDDIYNLELAYAPPYGPVYDPVIDICGKAGLEL
jgi:CoA-dependent NAD(P)H sulfur oxidoreductase